MQQELYCRIEFVAINKKLALKVFNDEVELNIRAVHGEVCAYVTGFFELPQCVLHADLLG